MADIFTFTAIITGVSISVEVTTTYAGTTEVAFTESRPATLAEADRALAAHGFGRVQDWDLGPNGDVRARVQVVDNKFNGVRAARLDDKIGTTHDEVTMILAREVQDGDLITDYDQSTLYVVAGSRWEMGEVRIHMVGEGETWQDRYTTEWPENAPIWVARRKA